MARRADFRSTRADRQTIQFMIALARASLRWPFLIVLCWLVATLLAAAGAVHFALSSDSRVFFADDDPNLVTLEAFERKYTQENNIIFVLHRADGPIISQEGLRAVEDLTEQAWRLPHSTRVESLTNYPHIVALGDDGFGVVELAGGGGSADESRLAEIEEVARTDPQILNRFYGEGGQTAGVFVNFLLPREATPEVNEISDAAYALAEAIEERHKGIEVRLTGNVLVFKTYAVAALSDLLFLIPLSLGVAGALLLVLLRSFSIAFAALTMLGLAAAIAAGVAGWVGHRFNMASVAAPVIIMTIGMATAVHLVNAVTAAMRKGADKEAAILEGFRVTATPIILTSVTTAVGFLALNFADAPPFQHIGNLVFLGIAVALALTFTWLPAVLSLLPFEPKEPVFSRAMPRLARLVTNNPKALLIAATLAIGGSFFGLPNLHFDDDYARYFDERFEFRRDSDFAEKHLTGLTLIEFDLETNRDGGVYEPDYQRDADAFASWLGEQTGVVSVLAIPETTKRLHRAINAGRDGDFYRIPDERDLISQYFLIYELSLPYGTELTRQINVSRSASRVTAILRGQSSAEIRALQSEAETWLGRNAASIDATAISINVLFAHLSPTNSASMVASTLAAILIMGVIIAFSLRSVRYGSLSLITNLLPAVMGFAGWGLLIGEMDAAATVVVALTIGIVVDDTIHFLMKYRLARQSGFTPTEAIERVFETVGVAMAITTVALVIGFLLLTLSGFQINRSLGAFVAMILGAALLVDWFLLPPLLLLFFDRVGKSATR